MRAVVKSLVELAKGGNIAAAKLLMDRVLGRQQVNDPLEDDEDDSPQREPAEQITAGNMEARRGQILSHLHGATS